MAANAIPLSARVKALAEARQRIDLAAGLLAQALKLLAIREAQPKAALVAVEAAREILVTLVADIEGVR